MGRGRGRVRGVLVVVVGALLATVAVPSRAGAGPTCTDTWVGGSGFFDDSQFGTTANWREDRVPDAGSVVCIPTGNVTFFNLTRTIGSLVVSDGARLDVNGGTLTLGAESSIANVFLDNGGVLVATANLTVPTGQSAGRGSGQFGIIRTTTGATLTIDGTFVSDTGNSFNLDIDVVNHGTFSMTGDGTQQLGAGRTFTNAGTLTAGPHSTMSADPSRAAATLRNTGTITWTGDQNAEGPSNLTIDNQGSIVVPSGSVGWNRVTGTSTGTWQIGAPGAGTCATEPGTAPTRPATLQFGSSTITFAGGSVGGSGCLDAFGGRLDIAAATALAPTAIDLNGATLAVHGDRTLPELRIDNGGTLEVDDGTATASGAVTELSPGQSQIFNGNGTFEVPAGVPFAFPTFNGTEFKGSLHVFLDGDAVINRTIAVHQQAQVVNRGTLHAGYALDIDPAANLRNEGTILAAPVFNDSFFAGGQRGLDNVGTFRLVAKQLDMRVAFLQFQGGTMAAGRVELADGTAAWFVPQLDRIDGQLRLEGSAHLDRAAGTTFDALPTLRTIGPAGALELAGTDRSLTGPLTNQGRLALDATSSLTASSYTQSGTGTLATTIGASSAGHVSTTSATLDGQLVVSPAAPDQAAVTGATIVDSPSVGGAFASATAADGGTLTVHPGPPLTADYAAGAPTPTFAVTVDPLSVAEGNTGSANALVHVHVTTTPAGLTGPFTLPFTVTGVNATAGEDYNAVASGGLPISLAGGDFSVPVIVLGDDRFEADETVTVTVGRPEIPGEQQSATLTIRNDDPVPTVSLPKSLTESEAVGQIAVPVQLDRAAGVDLTYTVGTTEIHGALEGSDYKVDDRTVTIPAGSTQGFIHITIINEDRTKTPPDPLQFDDTREAFGVLLFRDGVELPAFAQVVIVDDDGGVVEAHFKRLTGDDPTKPLSRRMFEGNTTNPTLPFEIDLVGSRPDGEVTVDIDDDSADRTGYSMPTSVTFAAGESSKVVELTSLGDAIVEPDHDLAFDLQIPDSAVGITDLAQVTIVDDDQKVALTPSVPADVSEHDGHLSVTVAADPAPTTFVDVPVSVEPISTSADDLGPVPATLTIAPGATSGSIDIPIVDDTTFEADEQFRVVFGAPNQGVLAAASAIVTIHDDDPAPFSLSVHDATVGESSGIVDVDVTATPTGAPGTGFVLVPVTVQGITATLGQDMAPFSTTARIPLAGGTTSVAVGILDDQLFESDETFRVTVGRPDFPGEPASGVVTITDDDSPPSVSMPNEVVENEDAGTFTIDAVLSHSAGTDITYSVEGRDLLGASQGSDYEVLDKTVKIPAGATHGSVHVRIINEDRTKTPPDPFQFDAPREAFSVTLSGTDGNDVAGTVVVIVDDDGQLVARFARQPGDPIDRPLQRSMFEGNTTNPTLPLAVELAGPRNDQPVSVLVTTSSTDPALGGVTLSSGRIEFKPGDTTEPLTLTSTGDTTPEPDQTVFVQLQVQDETSAATDVASVTILDDDQDLAITPSVPAAVSEGDGSLDVAVHADPAPTTFVHVPVSIDPLTSGVDDLDVSGLPADIVLAPGATDGHLTIPIRNDDRVEPDQQFRVVFGAPTQGRVAPSDAVVTIHDDDAPPMAVHVDDATVDESAGTANVTVTATPTVPGGTGQVTLPVVLASGSATVGDDAFAIDGTVTVPAAGGTATARIGIVDDDRFEGDEQLTVTVGRPFVDGEQATGLVTIHDNDQPPAVTITSASPYAEKAGSVSATLQLARAAGVPLTYDISAIDGQAEAGEDFTLETHQVTIPAGSTSAPIHFTVIDDTLILEGDSEFFTLEADRDGQRVAVADVAILNDDRAPRASFVRTPGDPADVALTRSVVEGNTADPTVPLQVQVDPGAATGPVDVDITATGDNGDLSRFAISPTSLTFAPGDGPKTVTLTIHANTTVDPTEVVLIGLQTDIRANLGLTDDEAHVTIVDDDAPTAPDQAVSQFGTGWQHLLDDGLSKWLHQFDLGDAGPKAQPPVATPDLADHFGLPGHQADVEPQRPDPADQRLPDLCADLQHKGFTIDWALGGPCGTPEPTRVGDVIQVRTSTSLADLAKAAGFTGDPYDDATDGVLRSLATQLGLDATGGWAGDLTVTLVVGVDEQGFYVSSDTGLRLQVHGRVDVSGNAKVGGGSSPVTGSATADLTVALAPPVPRQRDLSALLQPQVDGTAALHLDVTSGPLVLGWDGSWSIDVDGPHTGPQTLSGTLTVPGLTDPHDSSGGASPTQFGVVGTLVGDTWHVDATGTTGAEYRIAGFGVSDVTMHADVTPDALTGSGSLTLAAALPSGPQAVPVGIAFGRDSVTLDGRVQPPNFDVGSQPVLLSLVDPFVHPHFEAGLPAGPLTGSVEAGAASATLLPGEHPAGTATGLHGTLDSAGALTLHADTVHTTIGGGAIVADLAGVDLAIGPGTGPNLFHVDTATATVPSLDDLQITFGGLFLTQAGHFGADSIEVSSQSLTKAIGLGGVLPFDVTDATVDFPDHNDLDHFEIQVDGKFDFDAFPHLGPGFEPIVGIGGPTASPSHPEDNHFRFSVDVVSLAAGVVRPLDVGPLSFGFRGLQAGDVTLGADLTLGGFVNGELQSQIGGAIHVDGPSGSMLQHLDVAVTGSLHTGDTTVLDIDGTATASGTFGPLSVTDLTVAAGATISFGPGGVTFAPRLTGLDAGSISFALGDQLTVTGTQVTVHFDAGDDTDLVEIGTGTVRVGDTVPGLGGAAGSVAHVGLDRHFVPRLEPGFTMSIDHFPSGLHFGLPEFIPLHVDSIGVTFPNVDLSLGAVTLTPDLLAGLRLRLSGGIDTSPTWPIGASVDGLEVDLGKVAAGQFPITNLDGFRAGVRPFQLGGATIGGGLKIGTLDANGTTVFYGEVFGDFSLDDIGAGADLVVTQYGPVLMKVRAPLGIPLGPTGIVLADAEGAAQFGAGAIPVPPADDPQALLTTLTFPTDLDVTPDVIRDAVLPAVQAGDYTWDHGFAMSIAGNLVVPATPGVISGRVTLGMNLGLPTGPADPPGLQLAGRGEVTAFGMPFGQAGVLFDLADPLAPSLDFAFASPAPGSPLSLLVPARATLGVHVGTDGVALATIEGMRVFATDLAQGTLAAGGQLFDAALDDTAARLDADHGRPLATLLLDLDGDGTVSTGEQRTITHQFLVDRLLGRNGVPALLPASVTPEAQAAAGRAATALMRELFVSAGELLASPDAAQRFGADALTAFTTMASVVHGAAVDALAAFGDRFDPSLTIDGALQPQVFGFATGDPTVKAKLTIDRTGLFLELEGSLIDLAQTAVSDAFPVVAPAVKAALAAGTLGIKDHLSLGAKLPVAGLVDAIVGSGTAPTFDPLDPNWVITVSGSLSVFGYETTELSGIALLPHQQRVLDDHVQKLFPAADGTPNQTPVDPNRIPITSSQHYDSLLNYGGLLVTASLRVPRLITDPAAVASQIPAAPTDPLQYPAWLEQVFAAAGTVDTPARVQLFLPGVTTLASDADATQWASSAYLEGVLSGKVFGIDIGNASLSLSTAGLAATADIPMIDSVATVTLNTASLAGTGHGLPTAGIDVSLDSAHVATTLGHLGVPAALVPSASGRFRAYTPGFDPNGTDRLTRFGGVGVTATMGVPGVIADAGFDLALTGRPGGGFDVHGSATAAFGPIAGVSAANATATVDVVGGAATVTLDGTASLLGATARMHGVLGPDLTGTLSFTGQTGRVALGGVTFTGATTITLTLARVDGKLVGSLGVAGSVTLPGWISSATGGNRVSAAACVDSKLNAEVALSLPAMTLGPRGLVRIGHDPGSQTIPPGPPPSLPPSPAACTLPGGGAPTATGPLFHLRVAGGQVSAVLDGSIDFLATGASVAGMTATGTLDGANGTGSLAVKFAGGSVALSGFEVAGSATATFSRTAFSMSIGGSLSVPGVLDKATVSGTATENGITHLALTGSKLTLPPLTVNSFGVALDRTVGQATYSLTASANVSFSGVGTVDVSGTLDSKGDGSLRMTVTNLTIAGATISNGQFALVRSGGTTALSASGRFSLFGVSLSIPQASLTLTAPASISGSLTLTSPNGPISFGGFTIGGTLRIAFTSGSASVKLDNGTIGIAGWGSIGVTADIAVPVQNGSFFQIVTPTGGLRLGGSSSPFFATGTFRLVFDSTGVSLSASDAGVQWKSGSTVLAKVTGSVTLHSNGSVNALLSAFSATLPSGFAFTVPSLHLVIDTAGANARLSLGAGSVAIPGLPALATPTFTIGTSSTFTQVLVPGSVAFGVVTLNGRLVFERQGGVFRLTFGPSGGTAPSLDLGGRRIADLPTFTVASDGTFSVDASGLSFGVTNFRIVGAGLHLAKTGSALSTLSGSITGGTLLVGATAPISLPTLSFDASAPFERDLSVPAWNLGPFLRASALDLHLKMTSNGFFSLVLNHSASLSAFADSSGLSLDSLSVLSPGNVFQGSVSGRLALFGTKLASGTFDVSRSSDGTIRLEVPASRPLTYDLGFTTASLHGFATSNGDFDFTGSGSASVGFPPTFSLSGSVSVEVSSASGVTGSYTGSVCIGACLDVTGSLRSDGQITGSFHGAGINAIWSAYLAGPGVQVDLNGDGDLNDLGDFTLGTVTNADTQQPSMTTPSNITVRAAVSASGQVRVYYPVPTATDQGTTLPVTCTPPPGSAFDVATTTVTCRARDKAGNTRTRTFTVRLQRDSSATVPVVPSGVTAVVVTP